MKILSFISAIFFLTVILISGCDKYEINYGEFNKVTSEQALLKVNYNIAYSANPGIQIKINGSRVSTLINTRYPYPGGGYNTLGDSRPDYLAVAQGNLLVSIVIPKKGTNIDSVELYKTNLTTVAGKNYTLHVTDTAENTKSMVTTDDFTLPDSGFVKYRLVNLMPNVSAIDLYFGTSLVASNIDYLKASEYFTMATQPSVAWTIRAAGSAPTSAAVVTYISANTLTNKRSYTIFATGYTGRTDAVRKPYLSFFLIK